ncbi:MAG: alpha-L-fucosidase [Clostridiales bacterium]|nr:alpha-L-fucosidase [Clostridiales bacterium]
MNRTDWFAEARFGLFLHWGLYAIPGRGEWTYAMDHWEPGAYEALIHEFDPVDFDPALWARLAKAAGMRYVAFTTRHHDGFCLFDSHYTDYKITNTPYGRDITRMLADAFRAEGLGVGFYHSLPDWTHPGYADPEHPIFYQTGKVPTATPEDHAAYQDLLYHHIEQLMTEYGKIDILFLDYTSQYKADEDYFDRDRILEMVYRNQPDIIVNDRLSYFKENVRDFDYYTPEICLLNEQLKVKGRPVLWETCATMNHHWGYAGNDTDYKDLHTLTTGLMGCVSQNGNLLLNIGPDPSGRFPDLAVDRLRQLADWYAWAGEAVFGCGASEYKPPYGCTYTQKDNVLYCYLLVAPMGDLILPQLKGKIRRITDLRSGRAIGQVNNWGFELLRTDEQRIRPIDPRPGDILKIELEP